MIREFVIGPGSVYLDTSHHQLYITPVKPTKTIHGIIATRVKALVLKFGYILIVSSIPGPSSVYLGTGHRQMYVNIHGIIATWIKALVLKFGYIVIVSSIPVCSWDQCKQGIQ